MVVSSLKCKILFVPGFILFVPGIFFLHFINVFYSMLPFLKVIADKLLVTNITS